MQREYLIYHLKMSNNKETNYCGFGHSEIIKPPYWAIFNADCSIHDDNYKEGGDREDRFKADLGFFWRMLSDINKLEKLSDKRRATYTAICYFVAVRFFGWISFRWYNKFK